MKITHFLLFTFASLIWLLICAFQLSVIASLVISFVVSPWFLFYTAVCGFLSIGITLFWGGLNTVPSLFWRFRKSLDTRIIEVDAEGRKYAAQIRLIGNA